MVEGVSVAPGWCTSVDGVSDTDITVAGMTGNAANPSHKSATTTV